VSLPFSVKLTEYFVISCKVTDIYFWLMDLSASSREPAILLCARPAV
jgi:hypothetical protein